MKRLWLPLTVMIVLAAIAMAGYWAKRPAEAESIACVDPLAGCEFRHRGVSAGIRFSQIPVPLEPFTLSVKATDSTRVSVEFQMAGMEMGFNRYDLRPQATGEFSSRITLPVCVSGRRDWVLYVDIDGSRYALPFSSR